MSLWGGGVIDTWRHWGLHAIPVMPLLVLVSGRCGRGPGGRGRRLPQWYSDAASLLSHSLLEVMVGGRGR